MLQWILEFIRHITWSDDGEVVMAWVQFIPLIISAASAAYGAVKEGKQRREQNRKLGQWNAENRQLFNHDFYSDYTQSAEAQNVIRQMRDLNDRQAKREAGSAVVSGATIEAQAAGKDARNRAMANLMANLGAQGTRRKERALDRYLGRKSQLQGLEYDSLEQKAQSAGNLTQNAIGGLGGTDWASIMGGNTTPYWQTLSPSVGSNISPAKVQPLNISGKKDVSGIKITNPLT